MKLAVVEVLDRDGHARATVPVLQWPVTVGRAVDCDVVLDDAHVAPLHATLIDADGVLMVLAGDTVNGVGLGRRRLAAHDRAELPAREPFVVGTTRLRVRRTSDPIAPERLTSPAMASRLQTIGLVAAVALWALADYWLGTDPGGRFTDYLSVAIGILLALAVWSGLWSVGSKLLQHRFDFWPHVATVSAYSLAMTAAGLLLPHASYASGWTTFSRMSVVVAAGIGWAMILAHLRLLLPSRTGWLTATMAAIFAAGLAVHLTSTYQTHDRLMSELYVTTLGPPAMRVASPVTSSRFIEEARALEAVLVKHAKDDEAEGQ